MGIFWNIAGVLLVLLLALAIAFVILYERLDRIQFRIDIQWKQANRRLLDWAAATECLFARRPEIQEQVRAFRRAKKSRARARLAQQLFEDTCAAQIPQNTVPEELWGFWTEKLALEEQLDDFARAYSLLAEQFNRKMEGKLTRYVVRLLRMKPYPPLQFHS